MPNPYDFTWMNNPPDEWTPHQMMLFIFWTWYARLNGPEAAERWRKYHAKLYERQIRNRSN